MALTPRCRDDITGETMALFSEIESRVATTFPGSLVSHSVSINAVDGRSRLTSGLHIPGVKPRVEHLAYSVDRREFLAVALAKLDELANARSSEAA